MKKTTNCLKFFALLCLLLISTFGYSQLIIKPKWAMTVTPKTQVVIKDTTKKGGAGDNLTGNPASGNVSANDTSYSFKFSPSVGMNIFYRNNGTQQTNVGAIPGVGYGIRWTPRWNKGKPVLSVDVFAQGSLNSNNNQYFSFSILPILTIYNWISVGYGGDKELGMNPTVQDKPIMGVFTIGVTKAL